MVMTIMENNAYWMKQDEKMRKKGFNPRPININSIMIWPGNCGYFVSYYDTASNHQKLVTMSKFWGEILDQEVKTYKWCNDGRVSSLEAHDYHSIEGLINFYGTPVETKKSAPQPKSTDNVDYKSLKFEAELKKMSENDYDKHECEDYDFNPNPMENFKFKSVTLHIVDNNDKTFELEQRITNEDRTETKVNRYTNLKDPVPERNKSLFAKYEKQGLPKMLWETLANALRQERWFDPEYIKILNKNDRCLVQYYNTKTHGWVSKTTDKSWGEYLAEAIENYDPEGSCEVEKYDEIEDIITNHCEPLT